MSLGKEFCVGVQAEHERRAVLAAHAKAAKVASLLAFLSAAQQCRVRVTGSRNMVELMVSVLSLIHI